MTRDIVIVRLRERVGCCLHTLTGLTCFTGGDSRQSGPGNLDVELDTCPVLHYSSEPAHQVRLENGLHHRPAGGSGPGTLDVELDIQRARTPGTP